MVNHNVNHNVNSHGLLYLSGFFTKFDHKLASVVVYYQGRIREEGMQQSTSKNWMGGVTLLEKYSNI